MTNICITCGKDIVGESGLGPEHKYHEFCWFRKKREVEAMTDCNKCSHILQYHAIVSQDFKVIRFDCGMRDCNCQLSPEEYKSLAV